MDIEYWFGWYDDEYLKFDRVENKRSNRPDLHAFLLLDSLVPGRDGKSDDMIGGAEHDEIYLSVDIEELEKVITEDQVLELIRCGVRYNEESLCMFA